MASTTDSFDADGANENVNNDQLDGDHAATVVNESEQDVRSGDGAELLTLTESAARHCRPQELPQAAADRRRRPGGRC